MIRVVASLLLLSAACAHQAVQESPGARLTIRDSATKGKKLWYLQSRFVGHADDPSQLVFDESKDDSPRGVAINLTGTRIDARKFDFPADRIPEYRMMLLSDDTPRAGKRGVLYLFAAKRGTAIPVMWWGLGTDAGFDAATGAENWAALKALFTKKP